MNVQMVSTLEISVWKILIWRAKLSKYISITASQLSTALSRGKLSGSMKSLKNHSNSVNYTHVQQGFQKPLNFTTYRK